MSRSFSCLILENFSYCIYGISKLRATDKSHNNNINDFLINKLN